MPKKYKPVPNDKRELLIHYIHEKGMNITQAALAADVYYPTAKVINKIYKREGRTAKKLIRDRFPKRYATDSRKNQINFYRHHAEQTIVLDKNPQQLVVSPS